MDESNPNAEFDLFGRFGLDQIRTETPVLLGWIDHVVIDPGASRRLKNRMIEEEAELAARLQHAGDLGDGGVDLVDVLEDETRGGGVEGLIGERQLSSSGTSEPRTATTLGRNRHTIPGGVDAEHCTPLSGCEPGDLAVATSDVENPSCSRQLFGCERQDLLDVLGISALGESLDPPICVGFPQVLIATHPGRVRSQPMKFSAWPNPNRHPDEVLDLAQLADQDGWYCFWYADHYMPDTGDESFKPGAVHECWSMLPAVAAATSSIRLGPLVAPTSVHHPALLANRAATIDQLSGGRFVLGLGAGWQINEHAAYGIDLEAPATRVNRFEESIQIVRSLLDQETTTFDGSFYKLTDAPCDPKPVQAKLPIVVGTGRRRMLEITARHAQEWNTWGAPLVAAETRLKFIAACEAVGTDPLSMHTSVQALVVMSGDQSVIDAALSGPMGDRTIAGSDDHIAEQLGLYADNGFDEFILFDATLGQTHLERLEGYRRFDADIASQF